MMPRFDVYRNPNSHASHTFSLDVQSDLVTTATRWFIPLYAAQPGQPVMLRGWVNGGSAAFSAQTL